nr:hypothetical protein B0A51_10938 [Rachicladosporium sp. CCFEE 5018]
MVAQRSDVKAETDLYHAHQERFCRFLLQFAQRVNYAATSTLTFRDICVPKQMRALALLVADAASPFPVPAGLLRALSDTIAIRRSVWQRHSASFASEESKINHLRFIGFLEDKVQKVLESKTTPGSKSAPSLSSPQSARSGSSPGLKKGFVASGNAKGSIPVPGTRAGTDTSPRRSSKPLRRPRTKNPSKSSFAALLELGQRANMSARTSSATLVAQPALGELAIAEDWQGPIDWDAGREEVLQPSTPRRTSASGTNGWPSPDHPFYFDSCPRVPGPVFMNV